MPSEMWSSVAISFYVLQNSSDKLETNTIVAGINYQVLFASKLG